MKLKNILLTGISLLAIMSCSKDDQPVSVNDMRDAKLSISLFASGPATKADDDANALPGEANINNVTVLTFTNDGSAILNDPYWAEISSTDGTANVLNIPTKATAARIAILANIPQSTFNGVANYSDFEGRLAQLSDQHQDNMAMSCQVITAETTLTDGDNYLGYSSMGSDNINGISSPLELTRLAARVELVGLKTAFTETKMLGRTVRINNVYLRNQKTASHCASPAYWGAVMADGNLGNSAAIAVNQNINNDTSISGTTFRQYTMENTDPDNATEIVINATIIASNGYQEETREFSSPINANGINHKYIKRNYIYRLNITFGDNSFEGVPDDEPLPPTPPTPPTPVTGSLTVQVEVVGWGPINQDVVIK